MQIVHDIRQRYHHIAFRLISVLHQHGGLDFGPRDRGVQVAATKHCRLRTRGNQRLKAPRNEELYRFLFERAPPGRLHRALADCRVTLASYMSRGGSGTGGEKGVGMGRWWMATIGWQGRKEVRLLYLSHRIAL